MSLVTFPNLRIWNQNNIVQLPVIKILFEQQLVVLCHLVVTKNANLGSREMKIIVKIAVIVLKMMKAFSWTILL